jgi:NAD(P)H-dependent FMN reductase
MTRLLALAASTRSDSLNKRLLAVAATIAEAAGATVTTFDYADCTAPLYEGEPAPPLPPGAKRLSDALRAHDGMLLATPEYNWSIPAALKNLIDWLSVDPAAPLKGRTALLMCASPSLRGGISGLQQLNIPLAHLGMFVYPQLIGVGDADTQVGDAIINREKDHVHLSDCVRDFVRITTALRSKSHA